MIPLEEEQQAWAGSNIHAPMLTQHVKVLSPIFTGGNWFLVDVPIDEPCPLYTIRLLKMDVEHSRKSSILRCLMAYGGRELSRKGRDDRVWCVNVKLCKPKPCYCNVIEQNYVAKWLQEDNQLFPGAISLSIRRILAWSASKSMAFYELRITNCAQ